MVQHLANEVGDFVLQAKADGLFAYQLAGRRRRRFGVTDIVRVDLLDRRHKIWLQQCLGPATALCAFAGRDQCFRRETVEADLATPVTGRRRAAVRRRCDGQAMPDGVGCRRCPSSDVGDGALGSRSRSPAAGKALFLSTGQCSLP